MSEDPDAAKQEERSRGSYTAEELRADMKRMREDLADRVNAFIKILDAYARPAGYSNPPDINASRPIDADKASGS
ncbi:hypothetical protein HNP98_002695 [Hymenobacter sp. 9A]|uniref:TraR/DksA family transcriptional regulator n=1 Tax=Hymenobacter caeli TaxID=2735894 RepID=A0ABX2FRU9_9BACT|nr:hypothetical protein [Hymenobacter caeli]